MKLRAPLAALCATLSVATGSAGQATSSPATVLNNAAPAWMTNWSPLRRIADLPRELPGASRFAGLLSAPAPRVGEFWTAGNPGALGREVHDSRADFRFDWRGASGDYIRPLDPAGLRQGVLGASGWRRHGQRSAVVGNAVFDRTHLADSVFSDVLVPYGSNPFIVIDSMGHPTRRSAIRLEGAMGRDLGRLGLGFAVGWEGQSNRTAASAIPRSNRTVSPGVAAGLSYDLGTLALGVLGRWRRTVELIDIRALPESRGVVLQLEGYAEPVVLAFVNQRYTRRYERDALSAGATAAFNAPWGKLALYALRERASEDQFAVSLLTARPPDNWSGAGWTLGGAGQYGIGPPGADWLLTFDGKYRIVAGDAHQASIDSVVFEVSESQLDVGLDLRARFGSDWQMAVRGDLQRVGRERSDLLVPVHSDVRATMGGGSIELSRMVRDRLGIAAGIQVGSYGPAGLLPDPMTMGPKYGRYVAPGLALELAGATIAAGTASVRWQLRENAGIWIRGVFGSSQPRGDGVAIPMRPEGSRRSWALTAGAALDAIWPVR